MHKTMTEKIFSRKAGKDVKANDFVVADVDRIMSHDSTTPLAITSFNTFEKQEFANKEKVVIVFDHVVPAPTITVTKLHNTILDFANKNDLMVLYGEGICHQILPEKGLVKPGNIVIGADSHSCTYGAFGAFGTGMGSTDIAVAWKTGKNWFKVPETIRIEINGELSPGVFAKDLMLSIIGKITASGATYKVLEFGGETVKDFTMSQRLTLANMAIEAGAKAGLVEIDKKTLDFCNETDESLLKFNPAEGATYSEVLKIDATEIEPVVAAPHTVDNIKKISEVEGTKVNQVFIGTCTNGRLDDLQIAADVVKGKTIAKGMRFIVTPASKKVYQDAIKDGTISILVDAGAIITNPGCGPCIGRHEGVLGENEVAFTTMNRNFKGRMGDPSSKLYIGSPYIAAVTALKGKITWRGKE